MAPPLHYPGSKPTKSKETVMNIKAIIASLVLGSSSIAMASPSVTFSANAQGSYGTTVVRDHRADDWNRPVAQPIAQPAPSPIYYRDGWRGERMPPVYRSVTLASDLHFAADGRTSITVGGQAGRFDTLQISASAGPTFIKQVYVQFDNGQEQVVRGLNRTLSGNQSLSLDLDGSHRAIRRIVVYGSPLGRGWRRAGGTFTVTAA
jgi:hypothetical protein